MACAAVVLDRPAAGATQLSFYLAAGWCLLPEREDASITLHDFKVHAAAIYLLYMYSYNYKPLPPPRATGATEGTL